MRLAIRTIAVACFAAVCVAKPVSAAFIDPFYAGSYAMTSLGGVSGVPAPLGGVTFKQGDTNTLLIGGSANNTGGAIYSVGVVRDSGGHITGFSGPASFFADADSPGGGIDGGLQYGPNGVLFYTSYHDNYLGQIKPGSTGPDKLIGLDSLGIANSVGALAFTPAGYGSTTGHLKLASYNYSRWYDATISADGGGTFNVTINPGYVQLEGGIEGIAFVPLGSELFANPSVLIAEWAAGNVVAYDLDSNGNPIVSTRRLFIDGLSGAEGAVIDPVTGDFIFSTFGGGNQVVVVQGFSVPPPENVPVPGALSLVGLGVLVIGGIRRRI
ncbi:MAG: hypothetical protein KDE14_13580 [Rhodobacteraceae bacterium]|nr:hypothetical protein [Paracoccaceae bacterium]